jgi:hypothetical protein
MAEVVAYSADGIELVYDTDDVEEISTPRDVHTRSDDNGQTVRELGQAHLHIAFKPGKCPLWREAASGEGSRT